MPDAPQQTPQPTPPATSQQTSEPTGPAAAASTVPTADPYRAIARGAALVAVPVGVAMLVVAALVDGAPGLVAAVVGLVVVLGVLGSSPLIMSWAVRSQGSKANPHFAVMVAMGSWIIKFSVLALLVILLAGREWLDSRGFALGAGPTALVWLVAEMRAFAKVKMPIYDAAP